MAKQKHGLVPENTSDFFIALTRLLKDYSSHLDGSKISLKTSNLSFKSEDVSKCKPECVRIAEVCDKNGKNCHIKVWCECDDENDA